MRSLFLFAILIAVAFTTPAPSLLAQNKKASQSNKKKQKKPKPFKWVNPVAKPPKGLKHATFLSPSMKVDVGYCIYLPTAYSKQADKRFPVVYWLHGGRPGSESRNVSLIPMIHQAIEDGKVPPMIYVLVNGGPVSHYNYRAIKNGLGADVFIKELIPHIDESYRTIASREGRGLEGFSQGGRGTARLMFRYPNLFCSGAAGGGGHATEKRISENGGAESEKLKFDEGDNTWDLARDYAKRPESERNLNVMIYVGTKGFNYENNLQYMKHLDSLNIPYQKLIVPDAPHSAKIIYQKNMLDIMRFHARNFGL